MDFSSSMLMRCAPLGWVKKNHNQKSHFRENNPDFIVQNCTALIWLYNKNGSQNITRMYITSQQSGHTVSSSSWLLSAL